MVTAAPSCAPSTAEPATTRTTTPRPEVRARRALRPPAAGWEPRPVMAVRRATVRVPAESAPPEEREGAAPPELLLRTRPARSRTACGFRARAAQVAPAGAAAVEEAEARAADVAISPASQTCPRMTA